MAELAIRTGRDHFDAFKIGVACLRVGGTIVSVTASPLMEFDHNQSRQRPVPNGPLTWIVWMTFQDGFDFNVLDTEIEKEA